VQINQVKDPITRGPVSSVQPLLIDLHLDYRVMCVA